MKSNCSTAEALVRRAAAADTEAALLSAAMMMPEAADEVVEKLAPEDFGDPHLRLIFQAVRHLRQAKIEPDIFAIQAELERRHLLETVGGLGTLTALAQHSLTTHQIDHHAAIVRGFAELRRVADAAAAIMRLAAEADWSEAPALAEDFADRIAAIGIGQHKGADQAMLRDAATGVLAKVKEAHGKPVSPVPTIPGPIKALNALFMFRPGQSYVVSGRPGTGKTTVMQNIAMHVAEQSPGGVVVYFSVEMPTDVMAIRALSATAGIPTVDIERGNLNNRQLDQLHQAHKRIATGAVWIFHQPRMSIGVVASVTRRLSRFGQIAMIVVDYLQRFRPLERLGNQSQELAEMAAEALAVGQTYKCPVLIGSQLNRELELKGSDGPLEDAAAVMALTRTSDEEVTVTMGKNRFGPSVGSDGTQIKVAIGYNADTGRIYDVDENGGGWHGDR